MIATVIEAAATVTFVNSAFAYNKYGFDSQKQCINITNLEFQGGFFDNSTYTKLIDTCEHRTAATNTTSP
jgi:hypothetical protein